MCLVESLERLHVFPTLTIDLVSVYCQNTRRDGNHLTVFKISLPKTITFNTIMIIFHDKTKSDTDWWKMID